MPAREPSITRVPSPPAGEMNASPQGRLPNAPGSVRSPASGIAGRPERSRRRSVPLSSVTRASEARSSASATACPFRRSPSMSALITRASMSSVTPGRVAQRAPASVALFRAAVCERDWTVGAISTSAAAIASATTRGGSAPCEGRSLITVSTASAPASAASSRRRSPTRCVAGLQMTRASSPSFTPRHSTEYCSPAAGSRSLTRGTLARRYDLPPAGVAQSVRAAES